MSLLDFKRRAAAFAGRLRNSTVLAGAIDFDGANDYLYRNTDLAGNTDGKTFTFSAWVYPIENASTYVYEVGGGRFYIEIEETQISVVGVNSGSSLVLSAQVSSINIGKTWVNIIVSLDLSNGAKRSVYIGDTAASVSWSTYVNDNIDFTDTPLTIADGWRGRLAGVFLDYTYRDLSIEANRRLFIDAEGRYVDPPTMGIISMPLTDPTAPGKNNGTGGDFSLSGVVARSGRGPNQYNAAASELDGSADWLSKSLSLASSEDFTLSCWVKVDATPTSDRPIFELHGSGTDVLYLNWRSNDTVSFKAEQGTTAILNGQFDDVEHWKWYNIVLTFDGSTGTGKFFVNGVDQSDAISVQTAGTVDFADVNTCDIMSNQGFGFINGALSDLWFDTTYIDLSANNPFFDTETGKPKFLGINGEKPTGTAPLIYLPMRADDAGRNMGTGGNFTVNSGPFVGARGPSEYWAGSAEFTGTASSLIRASALSGAANNKLFSLAVAIRPDAADAGYVFCTDNGNVINLSANSGYFALSLGTPAGTRIFYDGSFGSHASGSGAWNTLLVCIDMTDQSACKAFVDGTEVTLSPSTFTNDNIGWDYSGWTIGGQQSDFNNFDGRIGFLWMTNAFIDFSQEANRLKFFDAFGYPVDLGANGELPTGTAPLLYMSDGMHQGENKGTSGAFSVNGSVTDGGHVRG